MSKEQVKVALFHIVIGYKSGIERVVKMHKFHVGSGSFNNMKIEWVESIHTPFNQMIHPNIEQIESVYCIDVEYVTVDKDVAEEHELPIVEDNEDGKD